MPRYKGPARELKHAVRTLLDETGFTHFNASCAFLRVLPSEALRHAIELQYITIVSSKSIGSTMQPNDNEGTQP